MLTNADTPSDVGPVIFGIVVLFVAGLGMILVPLWLRLRRIRRAAAQSGSTRPTACPSCGASVAGAALSCRTFGTTLTAPGTPSSAEPANS